MALHIRDVQEVAILEDEPGANGPAYGITGNGESPVKKRMNTSASPMKTVSSGTDTLPRLQDHHSFTTHPSHQPGDQAATPLAADWLDGFTDELDGFTDELLESPPDEEQKVPPPPPPPPPPSPPPPPPPPAAVAGGGQPDAVRDPAGHATGISTATGRGGTCDVCLSAVMKGDQMAECVQCNWWACESCVESFNHLAPIHSLLGTLNGRLVRSRSIAAAYAEAAAEDEEEALEAERERCQLEWELENGDSSGSENEDIPVGVRLLEAEDVAKEVKIEAEISRSHADDYEAELAAVQAEVDLARAEVDEWMRVEWKRIRTERAKIPPCAARAKAPPAPRTGDSNAPYAATRPELSGVRCRCLLLLSEHAARSPSPC